jgi:hypothetical protein
MSVTFNQYLLIGVKLDIDIIDYDKYEDYVDIGYKEVKSKDGLTLIYDGMSGEYAFVGQVLKRSDTDLPFEEGGFALDSPNRTLLNRLSKLITEHFNITEPKIRIWVITHYH